MGLGPFDMTATPFLILYLVLFVIAFATSAVLSVRERPPGTRREIGDSDRLAWLAGRAPRLTEAVVTRLLATGALRFDGKRRFAVARRLPAADAIERDILSLRSPAAWTDVERVVRRHGNRIDGELVAAGQVMDALSARRFGLVRALPFALLIGFGAIKAIVGDGRAHPIGYLVVLLLITAAVAAVRYGDLDRRTEAGRQELTRAQGAADRLRRAPTEPELALAVALFGTSVLAGSSLADLHRMRSSDGGSGGEGSGDGGGGGGCGGCS